MIEDLFTPMHLAVLFAIIFFLFGAKRLPELGKSLGHGIREFRSGIAGIDDAAPDELTQGAPAAPPAQTATGADADVIEGEAHEVPLEADAAPEADAPPEAEAPLEAREERAAV